jgi:site-specific DNA recombinase
MKTAFAYIRVSTTKQGREGASLPEQRDSIQAFCDRSNLHIVRWFEEQESAAGRGRKLYTEMMKLVKSGKAEALVFHKIDRSTRNLSEWADVSELPEKGIEVHYSHEPVDLTTLHGRTAADVAAVFASAYIRNLKQEVKKGLQGRLKAGLYPFKAPLGYLDNGGGKVKTIDPLKGPLVRRLFEMYATGEESFQTLVDYANSMGFRGYRGNILTVPSISKIFRNPFYAGLISLKKQSENYAAVHEPIINMDTFKKVQSIINSKLYAQKTRSEFLFQRMLYCAACNRLLIGERKRETLVYYRCHHCKGVCLREELISAQIEAELSKIQLSKKENDLIVCCLKELSESRHEDQKPILNSIKLQIDSHKSRLQAITDAYLDSVLSRTEYETRKRILLEEIQIKQTKHSEISNQNPNLDFNQKQQLELVFSFASKYFSTNTAQKRLLLKSLSSNILISQKTLTVQWLEPFATLINREGVAQCGTMCPLNRSRDKVMHWVPDVEKPLQLKDEKLDKGFIRKLAKEVMEFTQQKSNQELVQRIGSILSTKSNETWKKNFKNHNHK